MPRLLCLSFNVCSMPLQLSQFQIWQFPLNTYCHIDGLNQQNRDCKYGQITFFQCFVDSTHNEISTFDQTFQRSLKSSYPTKLLFFVGSTIFRSSQYANMPLLSLTFAISQPLYPILHAPNRNRAYPGNSAPTYGYNFSTVLTPMDSHQQYGIVRSLYAEVASTRWNKGDLTLVAVSFGYSRDELAKIPQDSNLGTCCGNPILMANLKPGETVYDFGSGAGMDVFLAASKIGLGGKVVGIELIPEMIELANGNATLGEYINAEFLQANITDVPLECATADIIISNCVLNLVPDVHKTLAFAEMHRLLKPGGRLAITDVLSIYPLPQNLRSNPALYAGCVSGALEVYQYVSWLKTAGFREVTILDSQSNLNIFKHTILGGRGLDKDVQNLDFNDYIGCFRIYAVKK